MTGEFEQLRRKMSPERRERNELDARRELTAMNREQLRQGRDGVGIDQVSQLDELRSAPDPEEDPEEPG